MVDSYHSNSLFGLKCVCDLKLSTKTWSCLLEWDIAMPFVSAFSQACKVCTTGI